MANDGPTPPHHTPHRNVAHTAGVAAVVAFAALAIGYVIINYEDGRLYGLVRAAACVAVIAALFEIRLAQIRRDQRAFEEYVEARLVRAEFAEGYVAGIQRRPGGDGGHRLHSV
jgi:hypothetical protein